MDLETVYQNEFIKVEVNQTCFYIEATWLQQPTSADFRDQLKIVMDYALTHHLNNALFDVRARAYLEMADQNWLLREVVPMFLHSKLKFAYLVSQTTLAAMDIHRIKAAIEGNPDFKNNIEMNLFLDKEEAKTWLLTS